MLQCIATDERAEKLDGEAYVPPKTLPKDRIPCYDPGNMQLLGFAKAMTPDEVSCGGTGKLCQSQQF